MLVYKRHKPLSAAPLTFLWKLSCPWEITFFIFKQTLGFFCRIYLNHILRVLKIFCCGFLDHLANIQTERCQTIPLTKTQSFCIYIANIFGAIRTRCILSGKPTITPQNWKSPRERASGEGLYSLFRSRGSSLSLFNCRMFFDGQSLQKISPRQIFLSGSSIKDPIHSHFINGWLDFLCHLYWLGHAAFFTLVWSSCKNLCWLWWKLFFHRNHLVCIRPFETRRFWRLKLILQMNT